MFEIIIVEDNFCIVSFRDHIRTEIKTKCTTMEKVFLFTASQKKSFIIDDK